MTPLRLMWAAVAAVVVMFAAIGLYRVGTDVWTDWSYVRQERLSAPLTSEEREFVRALRQAAMQRAQQQQLQPKPAPVVPPVPPPQP